MIAAVYARKSTEQTGVADADKSVTRQVEHATAYAARKGWTVDPAHVYQDDGISGAEFDAQRPGLARLLNALRPRPPFGVLVMSEESRLGREQIETAYTLKQLITRGVRVVYYLEDRERTLDSATDKLLLSVSTFADEMEREKARQRTYDAMARKARAGHVTGGVVFGYDNVEVLSATLGTDGRPRRAHVVRQINPTEAAVVRRLFEGFVGGRGLTRLAKGLNADGVPPPRGHGHGWAPTAIREMLKRELYRGIIVWNQSRKRDRWGRKRPTARPAGEWVRVEVPALRIIPDALWEAAEARRGRARATFVRATGGRLLGRPSCEDYESRYLLSGLARCGTCGGALVGVTRPHGRQRATFYACAYRHKRGTAVCGNTVEIRQERLDQALLEALHAALDARLIEDAVTTALARLRATGGTRGDRRARLSRERALVETRIGHLVGAVAKGLGADPLLRELQTEETRRRTLDAELGGLDGEDRVAGLDGARMAQDLAGLADEVRDWLGARVGQVRQMLRKLFEGRVVCEPFDDARGRGYTFSATGDYARLLLAGRRAVNDGGVPDGIRTRASRLKIWGPGPG